MFSPDPDNGIFQGSPALQTLDNMATEQTSDHLVMIRNCEVCGEICRLSIEWIELHIVSVGMLPQSVNVGAIFGSLGTLPEGFSQWILDKKVRKVYPNIVCRCGTRLIYPMTPLEARRHVEQAMLPNGIASQRQRSFVERFDAVLKQVRQSQQPVQRR
jgi:hypothetical protein